MDRVDRKTAYRNCILLFGFDNLAKSSGFSTSAFNKFKSATDGTVSSLELMKQANNAMLLGITDSEEQMASMFDVAQRLGQSLGLDTVQAVESLVTGLGRQSKLMLDNLGIMVDTNKAYEDYADSIGKTTSELTDQERKTAFVNAAMKEANTLVSSLGEEQLTTADKISQMQTALGDLAITIGDKVAPFVSQLAGNIATLVEEISMLGMTPLEKMVKSLEDMGADKGLVEALKLDIANEKLESLNAQLSVGEIQMRVMKATAEERLRLIEEDTAYFKEQNMLTEDLQILTKQNIEDEQEKIDIVNEELAIIAQIKVLEAQILTMKKEGAEIEPVAPPEVVLEKTKEQLEAEAKLKKERKVAAKDFVSNMQTMGKAFPEMEKAGKRAAQVQALVDAYASANAAYKSMVGIPVIGTGLAIAASAAALGAGLANVKMIESAATGADFVTNGNQLLMVGDNPSGRERVQVTPLDGDPSPNAPSGSSVTVNVSGNVLSQDFVEGELAENIKEAIRRGTDFGIS